MLYEAHLPYLFLSSIQKGDDPRKNLNLLREGPKYMPAAAFQTSLFLHSEALATEKDMELSKGDSDAASSFLIWCT
ncbi:hypothetical protein A4A49_37153 [Nicotiana attenuata]|uniref:Uncharacterized protein n=1 Tax=Nicotiana attenuata TaxID=49451 RepID=A0A1J6IDA1_NICAT|nr:hypothetical protein A4A49_37153 [Nicotiana attenuata]